MKTEAYIHTLLCNYLRANYPELIFTTDLSGVPLPIGLAKKIKPLKSSRGIPDLILFHPASTFHGLLVELKSDDAKLFKQDGSGLLKDEHHSEQLNILLRLRALGYAAYFARGFENARDCIENYMRLPSPLPRTKLRSEPCEDNHPIEWVKCRK
jgi:hypothetical protein